MRLKEGVSLAGLVPQMVFAAFVIEGLYQRWGIIDPWITSGNDGQHSGKPVKGGVRDPHYEGKALDFRIHDVAPEDRKALVDAVIEALEGEFFVLWEAPGDPREHLHVQYGQVT